MKWTSESVRLELTKVFKVHVQDGADLTESSHLVGDLGIDSLGQMELIADIEDAFGLKIPDEALRDIETIGDVSKAIEARLVADGRLEG